MKVKNLSFSYNQKSFIKDLNIEFKENQITTIIGSNGSGKSTLLMLLSRIYKPQEGNIEIDEQNIWNYKIKDFAKKVAVVHQKKSNLWRSRCKNNCGLWKITLSSLFTKVNS